MSGFKAFAWYVLVALGAILIADSRAVALTYTWGSVGTDWNTAANWGGTIPTGTDVGLFNKSTYSKQPSLSSGTAAGGIWDTGSGAVTISGAGILTLNGTTINSSTAAGIQLDSGAGSLAITAPLALGGAQNWNVNAGTLTVGTLNMNSSPLTVAVSSGTTTFAGGTTTLSGLFTLSSGIIDVKNTYSSGSNGGIAINGGTYIFDSAGTNLAGTITLNSGIIGILNNTSVFGTAALQLNGGTMQSQSTSASRMITNAIALGGNIAIGANQTITWLGNVDLGGAARTITTNNTLTISGTVSDGGLIKAGGSLMVLSVSNSYTGDTQISNGTLQIGTAGAIPSGSGFGNVILNGGSSAGLLDLKGTSVTINGLSGTTGATLGQVVNSSGTCTLTVGNANASSTFNGLLKNASGTLAFAKTGTGMLVLGGASTFTGGTTITAGLVQDNVKSTTAGAFGAFNAAVSTITVQSGATVDINGVSNGSDFFYGLTIAGTGTTGQGALVNTGASGTSGNRSSPNITLSADATIGGSGDIYMVNAGDAADAMTLNNHTLTKIGGNTLYLTNTTVTAGTVNIAQGAISVATSASGGSAATFALSGGSLNLNGFNLPIGSLTGGSGAVALGSSTLTLGSDNSSPAPFGGSIVGTGGVIKTGTGTIIFAGVNSYSGSSTVNAGALQIDGTHTSAGAYTIANGATLAGTGTISGANTVSLNAGSALAPGDNRQFGSVGTLTLPALSFSGTNSAYFDLSSNTASGNDLVAVTGNLALGGNTTVNLSVAGGSLAPGNTYTLFTYGGSLTYGGSNALALASGILTGQETAFFNYGSGANSAVTLTISNVSQNLTWMGTNSTTWADNASVLSWASTANPAGDYFTAGDAVAFDNTAGAIVVTLSGAVSPSSVTVTGTNNFTFSGAGAIQGPAVLTVLGPGSLILANTGNSYSGGTAIQGGSIVLAANNALPTSGVISLGVTASAGTLDLAGYNQQIGGLTTGAGATAANQLITTSSGSSTLTFNSLSASPSVFYGAIQDTAPGGGTLSLAVGGGTLDVSGGVTSYSGSTTVSGGLLIAGSLSNTSAVSVNGGQLSAVAYNASVPLAVSTGGTVSLSGTNLGLAAVNNSGKVFFTGSSGTISLAALSGSGQTSFSANAAFPTLSAGVVTVAGSAAIGTASGGTANFNGPAATIGTLGDAIIRLQNTALSVSAGTQTTAGSISGSGSLTWAGPGSLLLGGTNTFAGSTFVSGGSLVLNNQFALQYGSTASNLNIAPGATVAWNTNSALGNGNPISGWNVNISGQGTFVSASALTNGVLTIAGSNTFSGTWDVESAGSFVFGTASASAGAPNLILNGGAWLGFNGTTTIGNLSGSSGGSLQTTYNYGGASSTGQRTLSINQTADATFSGVISGAGTGARYISIIKTGSADLTFFGLNTYSGTTTVNAGRLTLSSGSAQGGSLANSPIVVNSGGELDLNYFDALGAGNAFPLTVHGVVNKIDDESETLARPITLSGGTLTSTGTFVNGNGAWNLFANSITTGPGTSNFIAGAGGVTLRTSSYSFNLGSSSSLTIAVPISQYSSSSLTPLNLQGTGTLVLAASNNYTGGTKVSGGTLQLGNDSALGIGGLTANAGLVDLASCNPTVASLSGSSGAIANSGSAASTLTVNQASVTTFGGAINDGAGGIALIKTGAGTLVLSGSNGYSGGTTLSGGTLAANNAASLGAATGALTINSATLEIAGNISSSRNISSTSIAAAIQVDPGQTYTDSGTVSGSGNMNFTGAGTFVLTGSGNLPAFDVNAGAIQISGTLTAGTVIVANSAQLAGTGKLSLGSGLAYNSSAASTFAGKIGSTGGLTVAAGQLALSGSNNYSGATMVNGGMLRALTPGALPSGAGAGDVTLNGGGTLDVAGQTTGVNGFWGSGTVDNSSGTGTLIVGNNNVSSNFSGVLQNSGGTAAPLGLTKTGSGTFTLAGTNLYTGPTIVQGGVMSITSGLAGPAVVSGGTLDLSGFVQSVYSLTMGSSGALNVGLGNVITSAGTDSFAGTLDILGSIHLGTLMTYSGHVGSFAVNNLPGSYQLSYGNSELDIIASGPPTWSSTASGSWNAGANWTSNTVPSGIGTAAVLGAGTSGPLTITLDAPQTLGELVFSSTAESAGYTLGAGTAGSLIMNNSGSASQLVVNGGSHDITAPVYLAGGDLEVSASNNGMLTIGGSISEDTARNLILYGDGSGGLVLSGTNSLGGIGGTATVSSGTLVLNDSEALADGTSLTVGDASAFFGGIQPAGGASAVVALAPVPEPGTVLLLAAGTSILAVVRLRRKATARPTRPESSAT